MILLALDVGKVCGWALGNIVTPVPRCGLWPLPVRDKRDVLAARVAQLRDCLAIALHEWEVEVVGVAEAFRSRNSGEAAYKGALLGVIREECWRRRIRFIAQPENAVRKQILGRGSGPTDVMKDLAVAWCLTRGIDVEVHDVADAAVMFCWCAAQLTLHPLGGVVRAGRLPVQPELRSR